MTPDTSNWPVEARRLYLRLIRQLPYGQERRQREFTEDLSDLVSRLCPDPKAHERNPPPDWPESFDLTPEEVPTFEALWELMKGWDINIGDGICGTTGSHVYAIMRAIGLATTEPRGEPAQQSCDGVGDALVAAVSSALPDSRVQEQPPTGPSPTEPQEPDEPEWVRVAPSIAEALSALQSLYYAQMVREALRERAELLRALDTITERASRLESERDEARAGVDRLRAEVASVRADFFASQRG